MSNAYLFAQSVVHSDLSLWSEWQVVPYGGEYDKGTSARIQHVDGREIIIDMETWGRRSNAASTNIDGNYPRHFDGSTWSKDNKPEIGVNPSRPAEDISKAIAKRFLPTYTEFYELAVKETEERKRLHDEAVARLTRLAITANSLDRIQDPLHELYFCPHGIPIYKIEVSMYRTDKMVVFSGNMDLTEEEAHKVIALLREMREEK